jgi:type I restriction enzyme R subunit
VRGEEPDEEANETSANELTPDADRPVVYNPDLAIEIFDFIIVDECHRSIYSSWRQVLDTSMLRDRADGDAIPQTLSFFQRNLVAEYPYERSVVDGFHVGHEIFRIRTHIAALLV